jgi:glycosyltransferase involved in cell wall biosynthesis
MVITMVIDLYGDKNNGTTVTGMRTCERLLALGHEVRVIAYMPDHIQGNEVNGVKVLRCKKAIVPIFEGLIESEGFTFGKTTEKEIADFIKGSDVVHIMFPFPLEAKCRKVAKAMGIPITGAYHLQPENITYAIHLGKIPPVNSLLYHWFKRWMYRHIRTIHTPSETMKQEMLAHHYKGDIHAISNGVSQFMHPIEVSKPEEYKDKYVIVMVGRLAYEKRQDIIIKAIGHSKYNDKIQLILCGQGPEKAHYEKLSKKLLKNPIQIKFVKQPELREILNWCDLYVHASDIESEAIACIEAFACGAVPVISDSPYTATRHFSLDEHCLFRHGKYKSLRQEIEFFIEHPEYKESLKPKYVEYSKTFDVKDKVEDLVEVMKLEIARDQEDKKLNRTYYSSMRERRRLRKVARKAGITHPYIYKKDVYHSKEKQAWEK